ncbi:hypothetical protein JOB18_021805 [Solea senegalensis]|uniref:Uncharacterized protein n=1 Tax=Solea senegalensis TaxID=28829 RepID=A0AAV6PXB3_SOLSE|nr:hypothetical protein JOB18_021805 [Solea senegalensis]
MGWDGESEREKESNRSVVVDACAAASHSSASCRLERHHAVFVLVLTDPAVASGSAAEKKIYRSYEVNYSFFSRSRSSDLPTDCLDETGVEDYGRARSSLCVDMLRDAEEVLPEAIDETFSVGTILLGKSLVTAEPALMVMTLIHLEDVEPSNLLQKQEPDSRELPSRLHVSVFTGFLFCFHSSPTDFEEELLEQNLASAQEGDIRLMRVACAVSECQQRRKTVMSRADV